MKNKNLSFDEYLSLIKKKREEGSYDFSQQVFYKGKVLQKCPPNTHKMGATCVPGIGEKQSMIRKPKDLGGINPTQAKHIAQAKTSKDVMKAKKEYGSDKNRK